MLTRDAIIKEHARGRLHIEPFHLEHVGPNSIDLTLATTLATLQYRRVYDIQEPIPLDTFQIPPTGVTLLPGVLYLGHTVEECGSDHYIPCIEGRSSWARYGITVHQSAGFGDIGFKRQWTLEITVLHPITIYAGARICQAYFIRPDGVVAENLYQGKYVRQQGVTPSRLYEDFLDHRA